MPIGRQVLSLSKANLILPSLVPSAPLKAPAPPPQLQTPPPWHTRLRRQLRKKLNVFGLGLLGLAFLYFKDQWTLQRLKEAADTGGVGVGVGADTNTWISSHIFTRKENKLWEMEEDGKYEDIFRTYLKHRAEGMSQLEIADKVFNVLPAAISSIRPHSYPFLSGDTLRSRARVVIEEKSHLSRWKKSLETGTQVLTHGTIIFVKTNLEEEFAKAILPLMQVKFLLITHNSAWKSPQGPESEAMLDHPLLIQWFAQNPDQKFIQHPKLQAIPLGLENSHYERAGFLEGFDDLLRDLPPIYQPTRDSSKTATAKDDRPIFAYVNFRVTTNDQRPKIKEIFQSLGVNVEAVKRPPRDYLIDLSQSKFVVSPPGKGIDCHRTWESVLMGAIPIVQNSSLFSLYTRAPVLVVKDFSELATRDQLLKYQVTTASRKVINAQYWFDMFDDLISEAMQE